MEERIAKGLAELGRFDLLFSNACLHWIPHHETLLPALAGSLNPGGLLAVQMPLTQRSPFYAALGDLLREPRWQSLQAVRLFHNRPPEETYDILVSSFASVEMWETVYEHVLPGPESVLEWYRGSGLRPYLDRLPETERSPFEAALLSWVICCEWRKTDPRIAFASDSLALHLFLGFIGSTVLHIPSF